MKYLELIEKLDWDNEIKEMNSKYISIISFLKNIMLKYNIPLTYNNREKMKYELVQFVKNNKGHSVSLVRTSEIFLTKEDKKYIPLFSGCWCSHLQLYKK